MPCQSLPHPMTSPAVTSAGHSIGSILTKLSRSKLLRKGVARPFLFINERVWNCLPQSIKGLQLVRRYGSFLHKLVQMRASRQQYHGTFFLRNRPELALLRSLADRLPAAAPLQITVVACSNGAEVYSIAWTIRSARPDLRLVIHAVDISSEILDTARAGVYSLEVDRRINAPIFARLTEPEIDSMFARDGDKLRIRPWLRENIHWHAADATDPALASRIGPADIVIANRFLCHMDPSDAERCLRRLELLVKPRGYLFVSGVDLEIRARVALDLGWSVVPDLLEEIHNGDPSLHQDWPWQYWGLEPFTTSRPDWRIRYASVFCVGQHALNCEEAGGLRN